MYDAFPRFSALFAQLGLASDPESIRHFIERHAVMPPGMKIEDAPCWTPAQAALLREELVRDAEWAEVIDQLSLALRRA